MTSMYMGRQSGSGRSAPVAIRINATDRYKMAAVMPCHDCTPKKVSVGTCGKLRKCPFGNGIGFCSVRAHGKNATTTPRKEATVAQKPAEPKRDIQAPRRSAAADV